MLQNSLIIGELESAEECAGQPTGDAVGMVTGSVFQSQSGLPYNLPNNYHAVSSPAARGATMDIAGLVFKDFGSRRCGGESRAITLHASSADSVMLHRFRSP